MSELARANWTDRTGLEAARRTPTLLGAALWSLIAIYAAARFLQIFPGNVPMVAVIALHVLPPLLFALLHGARIYRLRGALAFIAFFLVIGNILENVSVVTGLPFGHYYFTELMGPKIFQVPIFLGLAYVGMAYLSWVLACVILVSMQSRLSGYRVVLVPALASLIMTSWDLSQDAVWSTYLHLWIWPRGGAYFGVPISNFLGWYLTVYLIYQSFALYLRGRAMPSPPAAVTYWRSPAVLYAISAAGNLLPLIRVDNSVIADPTGTLWKVRDIIGASALVSVFVMGAFVLWAWYAMTRGKVEVRRLAPRESVQTFFAALKGRSSTKTLGFGKGRSM